MNTKLDRDVAIKEYLGGCPQGDPPHGPPQPPAIRRNAKKRLPLSALRAFNGADLGERVGADTRRLRRGGKVR
ncbi:MAG: hypothetical protein ACT4QB_00760 [Gammaproteobacteria bacterium]